jgi:hypothetical protein
MTSYGLRLTLAFAFALLSSCSSDRGKYSPLPGGGGPPAHLAPGVCGDGVCGVGENCELCTEDCGECPQCSGAPACPAVAVPTSTTRRYDLDLRDYPASIPDGGSTTAPPPNGANCSQPQLRVRLAKVTVNTESEKLYFSNIYCMVRADDGDKGELALTPKTSVLQDGQSYQFAPSEGIFWGQDGLKKTPDNLTVTYDCWKVASDGAAAVLGAIAKAAHDAGSIAGPWGWAFGIGEVAAAAAAAIAQANSYDKHLLNAQQTISKTELLDLTNGRTWEIQKAGYGAAPAKGYWDWTLTVESWGCAELAGSPQ